MGAAYTAALWLLVRRLRLPGRGYLPEKTLCSLCFVAVAAVCAAMGSRPEAFWRLLPALLCCVVGDVVLALYNHLRRPGLFLAGLGAFLAGHALFVWGLCRLQPMGWPVPLAAVLGAVGAAVLSGMPGMQTGRMRPWVCLLYTSVTLTYWEEDINAYQMHSFSPGNATTLFISFSSHLREKGHLPVTFFDSLKYRQLAVLSFWYSYAKI